MQTPSIQYSFDGPGTLGAGQDGLFARWNNTTKKFEMAAAGGVSDHGALTGLSDDDHSIYALLAGRAGGQTLIGGTASGNGLTLSSTSHATKGLITASDATQLVIPNGNVSVPGIRFASQAASAAGIYYGSSTYPWTFRDGSSNIAQLGNGGFVVNMGNVSFGLGGGSFSVGGITTLTSAGAQIALQAVGANAAYNVATFKEAASQSAYTTTWLNSAGTVQAAMGPGPILRLTNWTVYGNSSEFQVGNVGTTHLWISNGKGVYVPSGSAGTVGLGFLSDYVGPDFLFRNGLYRIAKDDWALSVRGSQIVRFADTAGTGIAMGFYGVTPVTQQAGIVDADGTLADVTTKFNSLLGKLEAYGLLTIA